MTDDEEYSLEVDPSESKKTDGRISVMIDKELWHLIHSKICTPGTHYSDASEFIDEYINDNMWKVINR